MNETQQIDKLKRYLEIAIKLYAKARKITIDEARENVRDADAIARGEQ